MNQRFITQISESPYSGLRTYGRRSDSNKASNDVSRRIVTENEPTTSTNIKKQKSRLDASMNERLADISLLIGVQSNKDNIHININHNKFVSQKKYFPTLKGKLLNHSSIGKQNHVFRQPSEDSQVQRTNNQQKHFKSHQQSNSFNETEKETLVTAVRDSEHRNLCSQVQTAQAKRKIQLQQNDSSFDQTIDHDNLQKFVVASIRGQKDFNIYNKVQAPQSVKGPAIIPKRGNFMVETTKIQNSIDYDSKPTVQSTKNKTPQQNRNNLVNHKKNNSFAGPVPQNKNNMSNQSVIQQQLGGSKQQRQSSIESRSEEKNSINQAQTPSNIQQQLAKRVHPKIHWDMTDEEWNMFGDRFPIQYDKKKLLGRGGFSLVWLGEHRKTKEKFAIKQILSDNTHKSHMKEIWFGNYFFENGHIKNKFTKFQGCRNLVRFLSYDVKPLDTWIFYEICGESLGNHLYDLKGENQGNERVYRIHHKALYQTFRKDNNQLKKLLKDLASALDLLQDQRIVHSDLKTENILVKTDKLANGPQLVGEIKMIDYGSSFPFDDLKQFSMATPEYMCPEILNYILYENSLQYHKSLLNYLTKYTKPWVIDIWSLGCVILEIISGIPLWMSLKTIVSKKGKEQIEYGLFAVKGRVFEKIIERQIEVVQNLDYYIDQNSFGGIQVDNELRFLLKRMLSLNPNNRISPKEIIEYLENSSKQIVYTQ